MCTRLRGKICGALHPEVYLSRRSIYRVSVTRSTSDDAGLVPEAKLPRFYPVVIGLVRWTVTDDPDAGVQHTAQQNQVLSLRPTTLRPQFQSQYGTRRRNRVKLPREAKENYTTFIFAISLASVDRL